MKVIATSPHLTLLTSPDWIDYELLDSGNGAKFERYGTYTFIRPEHQAIWRPAFSSDKWKNADARFIATGEESGGQWQINRQLPGAWEMRYKGLRFQAQISGSRHMGFFPEQANHWDWMIDLIHNRLSQTRNEKNTPSTPRILNLFGYTGLATLAAASAGAHVTHVDASKKAVTGGRVNQELSGLDKCPIRWLVDDVDKFVRREVRRGAKYEGLILDPPKFGRGPAGQVWEIFEALPELLLLCRSLMSDRPLFIVLTAYAIRASALSIYYAMQEMVADMKGSLVTGELALIERSAGRLLSTAIFSRWQA